MNEHDRDNVIPALADSKTYRDFADAYSQTTGMPVSLTPAESWQLAHRGQPRENRFCAVLAQDSQSCAGCLRAQHELVSTAVAESRTIQCPHGLSETAVPVRAGERLLGFVRTGQVFRHEPTAGGFERTLKLLAHWNVQPDVAALRQAYFATRVVPHTQYQSAVRLLDLLAQHLSLLSNQLLLQQTHAESPLITRAKRFIEANQSERLMLSQVSVAIGCNLPIGEFQALGWFAGNYLLLSDLLVQCWRTVSITPPNATPAA